MWKGDEYYYSVGTLRTIANNYDTVYDGLTFVFHTVTNPWEIAEYRADFDVAWKALPQKMWTIVKYDIQGLSDRELEVKGFYDVKKYKAIAYRRMANYLNKT